MEHFPSIRELVEARKPDALLCDLWGVIHDGTALYPGVIDTLQYLTAKGVRVVFLSNAPRRATMAEENLTRLGIGQDLYDGIVTSGEATFHYLNTKALGETYGYIGPEKDRTLMDGSSCREVAMEDADFVICTGFDHDDSTLEEKLEYLEAALARKLTLVCANPDMEIVRINGTRALCAGVMAEWYEQQGGKALYFGKPYSRVYEMGLEMLGNPPRNKVIAVGDNLLTDIMGGRSFGLYNLLITGGVVQESLGAEYDNPEKVVAFCAKAGVVPSAFCPGFGLGGGE